MFKVGDRVIQHDGLIGSHSREGTIVKGNEDSWKVRFDEDSFRDVLNVSGRWRWARQLLLLSSPEEMLCEDWS